MSLCLCLALLILGDRAEKKKGKVLKSFALPSARADWLACGERQAYFVEVSTDEGGAKDTITTLSTYSWWWGKGARSTYGNHRVRGTLRNDDSQGFISNQDLSPWVRQ